MRLFIQRANARLRGSRERIDALVSPHHRPARQPPRLKREIPTMNYPLLPADAAAYAWQLACCVVTLLFAMFSWMIGPR